MVAKCFISKHHVKPFNTTRSCFLCWYYLHVSLRVIVVHSCLELGVVAVSAPTLCLFTAIQDGNEWGLHYIMPWDVVSVNCVTQRL